MLKYVVSFPRRSCAESGTQTTMKSLGRALSFTAKEFGAFEDFALVVGFARDKAVEASDEALILQRAKEDDPDDQGVCAEIPVQRFVSYDAVKQAALSPGHFSIVFYPDAIAELGGIGSMDIAFSCSEAEFAPLASMLKRIFRGHECFTVRNG